MSMSCRTDEESASSERLRADYKAAFEDWASQVNHFQAIISSVQPDSLMQQEQSRLEATEMAYRNSRDRLARNLVAECAKSS
jgi:hypothetical protein